MNKLITRENLKNHDELYEEIINLHDDLSLEDSLKANAKLILLLANHIGDEAVIKEAIKIAKDNI